MDEDQTIKERFQQAQGKEVPEDYFLYSCLEYERTHFPTPDELEGEHTWHRLPQDPVNCDPDLFNNESLDSLVDQLAEWYLQEYPQLALDTEIDYELLNEVVKPVVLLAFDLENLVKIKTKDDLPTYESGGENPFWVRLEKSFCKSFPHRYRLYLRYFQWCHAEEVEEDPQTGSRPPVGRYAPAARSRMNGGGGRRDGGGPRGGRGGNSGGRNNAQGRGRRSDGPPRGGRDRGGNQGRGRDRDRDGGGGRSQRGGRDAPSNRNQQDFEAAALKDVAAAVRKLKSDDSTVEVTLKPTNSFLRRLQHNHISKSGYYSYSTGEGRDRSVVVTRVEQDGNAE